jgi:prevent-host-death family protein
MKIASVAEVKAHFSAYLKESTSGPVVVTRNGKAVAVVLAVTDEDELENLLLAHSPRLHAILEAAHERMAAGKGIPHEQFWAEVESDQEKEQASGKRKKNRKVQSRAG